MSVTSPPTADAVDRLRAERLAEINSSPAPPGSMTTDEMLDLYTVVGTLEFKHSPRQYFNFQART